MLCMISTGFGRLLFINTYGGTDWNMIFLDIWDGFLLSMLFYPPPPTLTPFLLYILLFLNSSSWEISISDYDLGLGRGVSLTPRSSGLSLFPLNDGIYSYCLPFSLLHGDSRPLYRAYQNHT